MSKIPIPEIPEMVAPPHVKPDVKPNGEIREIQAPVHHEEGLIVAHQPMHEPLFQPVGVPQAPPQQEGQEEVRHNIPLQAYEDALRELQEYGVPI